MSTLQDMGQLHSPHIRTGQKYLSGSSYDCSKHAFIVTGPAADNADRQTAVQCCKLLRMHTLPPALQQAGVIQRHRTQPCGCCCGPHTHTWLQDHAFPKFEHCQGVWYMKISMMYKQYSGSLPDLAYLQTIPRCGPKHIEQCAMRAHHCNDHNQGPFRVATCTASKQQQPLTNAVIWQLLAHEQQTATQAVGRQSLATGPTTTQHHSGCQPHP
jgi:hypothetical protein